MRCGCAPARDSIRCGSAAASSTAGAAAPRTRPRAAGLGLAAERAVAALPKQRTRWLELASALLASLAERRTTVRQLVPDHRRAPHILALAIPSTPAAALRNVLASRGVYVSTGSACADGDANPSPALAAIGLSERDGMVRLSFAHDTTLDDVTQAATILADVVHSLGHGSAHPPS